MIGNALLYAINSIHANRDENEQKKTRPTHIPMDAVQCHYKHPNGNRINVNKISFNEKISSILGSSRRISASWLILSMRLFCLYHHHHHPITPYSLLSSPASYEKLIKIVCSLQCQCILLLLWLFSRFPSIHLLYLFLCVYTTYM